MRLMILGAGGQLGRALHSQAGNHCQICFFFTRSELDITDSRMLEEKISEISPDVIVNAAACTDVEKAESDPEEAFAVNTVAVGNLAAICSRADVPLIHISTDYVFDGTWSSAYTEDDLPNPVNEYGKSKHLGELYLARSLKKFIIIRTSWLFYPGGRNFVETMIRLFQTRNFIDVVDDQIGGPTYAGDLASAIWKICLQISDTGFDSWGIYHFAGEPCVSRFEFAEEIYDCSRMVGIAPDGVSIRAVSSCDYITRAERPLNSCMDLSKIRRVFGVEPSDWRKEIYSGISCYLLKLSG